MKSNLLYVYTFFSLWAMILVTMVKKSLHSPESQNFSFNITSRWFINFGVFFLLWIAFEFLENQLIFVGAHLWTIFCSNDQIVYFYTNTTVFWLLDSYYSVYNLYLYLYNNSWNQVALAFQLFEICHFHFHLNIGNLQFPPKKIWDFGLHSICRSIWRELTP